MGPRTDSSCCCQARNLSCGPLYRLLMLLPGRNLSWAPVPPPHAAARSRVCQIGPCTASHCCCLPSPHSAMCPLSGLLTLLVGSILS
ncbi:unnamed protein product [Staurois parvus]|uniref:Uncharacterized protein n=1 Tax=Staurois parvus TaxID=386267 RepID=A0ABN9F8U8_9NEOB|nr:unnamed protein product [Staurois parvus]